MNQRVAWFPAYVAFFRDHAATVFPEPALWIAGTPILYGLCDTMVSAVPNNATGEKCNECLEKLARLSTTDYEHPVPLTAPQPRNADEQVGEPCPSSSDWFS